MARLTAETTKILAREFYTDRVTSSASITGMLDAAAKADDAIRTAREMPDGDKELDLVKNLFKTVQGVEYDSKCPHGLPFYACMACSH
jgi:hypothetical protein